MNTPFKRRNDPFAESKPTFERKEEQAQVVEQVKPVEQPIVREVVQEVKPVEQPKPVKTVAKQAVVDDADREKYTATMEKSLRRRIKVACALSEIQLSTFIEQACLEKLEREGK